MNVIAMKEEVPITAVRVDNHNNRDTGQFGDVVLIGMLAECESRSRTSDVLSSSIDSPKFILPFSTLL